MPSCSESKSLATERIEHLAGVEGVHLGLDLAPCRFHALGQHVRALGLNGQTRGLAGGGRLSGGRIGCQHRDPGTGDRQESEDDADPTAVAVLDGLVGEFDGAFPGGICGGTHVHHAPGTTSSSVPA